MLLSIIIVSYNTKDLTLQTLQSIADEVHSSELLKNQTEIFVTDNNSSDDSVKEIKEFAAESHKQNAAFKITLITNKENLGFAKANNQGIAKSTGDYILLLNSDTKITDNALTKLVSTFQHHPIDETTANLASQKNKLDRLGILAADLIYPNSYPQQQGGSFPTLITLTMHMLMFDDLPVIGPLLPSTQKYSYLPTVKIAQTDWVGGTAMMIRRAVFDEIGTLDENIFMYGEDVEFCMRAKDHHWDVAILTPAKIIHYGSASSTSANALIGEFKGYLYIWSKHKPLWQMPWLKVILQTGALLRSFLFGSILDQKPKAAVYDKIMHDVLR